jgi:hypothetical protein
MAGEFVIPMQANRAIADSPLFQWFDISSTEELGNGSFSVTVSYFSRHIV